MIRRITLENYMSHAHTVIEPAEGLTVLVGPNNCGKSAVVSALLTVCGENDGDFMVRHGEKVARVTVETAEGDTITWQRKRTPSYVINGREVHRVGRGNLPDDLQSLLKLPVIEFGEGAGRNRFLVHFGLQKEPIFLINSEADVAKFFSSSAESERLLGMQKRHKHKTQLKRGEHRTVEEDLKSIAGQLESLAPLDAVGVEVEAIEVEYRALNEGRSATDGLRERIRRIETASAEVDREGARVDSVALLASPPALDDLVPLDRSIGQIARNRREASELVARGGALSALPDPPATSDAEPLSQACSRLAQRMREVEVQQAHVQAVEALRDPPVPDDVASLNTFGHSLRRAHEAVEKNTARVNALAALVDVPALTDLAPAAAAVALIGKAISRVAELERDQAKLAADVADVERGIIAWVTANPLCPVCGGAVQRERVLETGGPLATY